MAHEGIELGDLPTQTDVKVRWPEGSIKFAVISANVPAAGTYPLTAAAAGTGAFSPQFLDAAVRLAIGGTIFTAALPEVSSVAPGWPALWSKRAVTWLPPWPPTAPHTRTFTSSST